MVDSWTSTKLCCCCPVVHDSLWPHGLQHTRPPCPSPSPKVCPSLCPLHQWCHSAISFSLLFSFYPQSFPASGTSRSQMFSSAQFSRSVMSTSFQPHGLQHARLPCPSPTPGTCSNSCLSSQWCHPTISPSVIPLSSCLQSFSASGSFPRSQFFASDGQSIGVSASASVLPMNTHDWFPLGLTGSISLQFKGLSSLLQHHNSKHHFFSAQLSLQSNSHIHMWLLEKHNLD